MKTAFSSFIYSRRGIYGILHIFILLMSLFLVISISIDTFHNIPFLNQGSYLKIQFWICMFFLFDFLLEFFLSKEKGRYFTSHFIFLLVSIPYLNIIDFYHITFSPEISYFLRFIPLLRGGYALAIVVGWLLRRRDRLVRATWALAALWWLFPTVHPWYLLWLLPLVGLVRSRALWCWAAALPLTYEAALTYQQTGVWTEALWPRWIALLALLGGAALDLRPVWAQRRARSGRSTP